MPSHPKHIPSFLALCLPAMLLATAAPIRLGAQPPLGHVTLEQVEALARGWRGSLLELDRQALRTLAGARQKADVQVFFDPASGDSQRNVPRLLDIVKEVGKLGGMPFSLEFIAADAETRQPAGPLEAQGIRFFPTFVVSIDGKEVGRIVERAPRGLEGDLALLLEGETSGLLSASESVIWYHVAPPGTEGDPRRR